MPKSQQTTIHQLLVEAVKLEKQNKYFEAIAVYQKVLSANEFNKDASASLCELRRKLSLNFPEPSQQQLGVIMRFYNAGNSASAEQACETFLKQFPYAFILHNVLGAILIAQHKAPEALQAFDRAIMLSPENADAFFNRGIALYALGQLEEAVVSYDRAIQLNPGHLEAHNNKSAALYELGKKEEAIVSYNKTLQLKPDYAEVHRNLSHLKEYSLGDPQITAMEYLLVQPTRTEHDRLQLLFALAKAYDDIGNQGKSFDFLKEGNRLRKKELNYDIHMDLNLIANIKRFFKNKDFSTYESEPDGGKIIQTIFIVGMLRSGTSLTEQIIASHKKVYGAGEFAAMEKLMYSIPWQHLEPESNLNGSVAVFSKSLREGYLEEIGGLNRPENIYTDKMPLNFRWIGFILLAFPHAKIINLNRDPIATCWSCFRSYFSVNANGYAYDLNDLASFYHSYSDLMSFWKDLFPGKIYDLNYESLTENQEEETQKLLDFCGLEMQQECLEFYQSERAIKTASTEQVRKKLYQGSSDAWKKYEDKLKPLINALGCISSG